MESVLNEFSVFRDTSVSVDLGAVVEGCADAKLYNYQLVVEVSLHVKLSSNLPCPNRPRTPNRRNNPCQSDQRRGCV